MGGGGGCRGPFLFLMRHHKREKRGEGRKRKGGVGFLSSFRRRVSINSRSLKGGRRKSKKGGIFLLLLFFRSLSSLLFFIFWSQRRGKTDGKMWDPTNLNPFLCTLLFLLVILT